jgi:hypothetical protein
MRVALSSAGRDGAPAQERTMSEPTSGSGKKPLAVYAILERKDRKHWFKIGAAFPNRDGSMNVYLDALPVGTNCLQIREQRVWDDARPPNGNGTYAASAEVQP